MIFHEVFTSNETTCTFPLFGMTTNGKGVVHLSFLFFFSSYPFHRSFILLFELCIKWFEKHIFSASLSPSGWEEIEHFFLRLFFKTQPHRHVIVNGALLWNPFRFFFCSAFFYSFLGLCLSFVCIVIVSVSHKTTAALCFHELKWLKLFIRVEQFSVMCQQLRWSDGDDIFFTYSTTKWNERQKNNRKKNPHFLDVNSDARWCG